METCAAANGDAIIRCRLRWHRHVDRKGIADYVKVCAGLKGTAQ